MLSEANWRKFIKYWRAKGPVYAARLATNYMVERRQWKEKRVLEICITDYCNLSCPMCCHRTPVLDNRQSMEFEEFQRIGGLLRPGDFIELKLSGGEPTVHPDFRRFASEMRNIYPVKLFTILTNGCLTRRHADILPVFDKIGVSAYYENREEVEFLASLGAREDFKQTRIEVLSRTGSWNWDDVNAHPNVRKAKPNPRNCLFFDAMFKVVQGRLYRCCVAFGVCIGNGLPPKQYSIAFDEKWRDAVGRIDMAECCRYCHVAL